MAGAALREKVERVNAATLERGPGERVIAYVGQTVLSDGEEGPGAPDGPLGELEDETP